MELNKFKNDSGVNNESNCEENFNLLYSATRIDDDLFLEECETSKTIQIYQRNENIFKKFLKLPFICSFFYLIIIITILVAFVFVIIILIEEPNFYIFNIPWETFYLNDLKFENYHFDNGLEVMLIQDQKFEMDGGAIVINKGYMDSLYDDGIAHFATLLLSFAFSDPNIEFYLNKYFGNYKYEIEEYFINFRFDILNRGFKNYLSAFGSILNPNNISKFFDDVLNNTDNYDLIINSIKGDYQYNSVFIKYREKHLLEKLVYGFKNENNNEILPEGNFVQIEEYIKNNRNELKEKTMDYINKLINPKNIKIVLFSRYKFLITSKYMKTAFKYLINKKNEDSNINVNDNKYEENIFKKSQIIYTYTGEHEPNYIKIIYFIDKIGKETYSEFYYKTGYFNYIIDILTEKKEGSLYSLLTKNSNACTKSIKADFEYILRSKIKFNIYIELNCLKNINDIIYNTYQYIHNIINDEFQIGRYLELKKIYNQTLKYTEKTYDTMDISKFNGKNIINTKYRPYYYFYRNWVPWEVNKTYKENIKIIKNETNLYFSQLKPKNSVIVIATRTDFIRQMTCNRTSLFPLDCSFFFDYRNIETTEYYYTNFMKKDFNCDELERNLEKNIEFLNISSYVKNNFISNHSDIIPEFNEPDQNLINISQNILNNFWFKRNVNIRIPKLYISINLLHPFLRPLTNNKTENDCFYFQIFEMFSLIKKKVEEVLADAIRAGNKITIYHNENYLYFNIICYEDVAYNIIKEIKNVIFDTKWEETDFIENNAVYKYEALYNFFNFGMDTLIDTSKYYFYCRLKNGLYNKYEFNKTEFDNNYNKYCSNEIKSNINSLNKFIINGFIYGYYNDSEAGKISKIFNRPNLEYEKDIIENLLLIVNNTIKIDSFIDWTNEIKQLKEDDIDNNIVINKNIVNKGGLNFGFRFISLADESEFNDNYMNLSLLENMFTNIDSSAKSYLNSIQMFIYRDIYFYLFIIEPYDKEVNPNNDTFINQMFNIILNDVDNAYNQTVDNLGDRFYYLQKNLQLVLFKRKTSLEQFANEELNHNIYKYSILNPDEIIKRYNNNKEGKDYKFIDLRDYFNKRNKNKKYDVNTDAETN